MIEKRSSIMFLGSLITSLMNTVIFILASRIFETKQFGYLSAALSIFNIYIQLSDLNFYDYSVKKISEFPNDKNEYFSIFAFLKIILLIILSLGVYFVIRYQQNEGSLENNAQQSFILLIIFIYAIFESVNHVFFSYLQGQKYIAKMQISKIIGQIARFIICIIAILIHNFYIYVFSLIVAHLIIFLICLKFSTPIKIIKPDKSNFLNFTKFGIFTSFPQVLKIFAYNLGPLILLIYYDESLLGIYFVIKGVISFFNIIDNSAKTLLIPEMTPLISFSADHEKLKNLISRYEDFMIIISFLLSISAIILGKHLIKLFLGEIYVDKGYLLLVLLTIYTLNWGLLIPYIILNFILENIKLIIGGELIRLALSLICWIIFIPLINIYAIDLGIWISFIVNSIVFRIILQKKYKIGKISRKKIFSLIIGVFFLLISWITSKYSPSFLFSLILNVVLVLIYIFLLWISKIIIKEDFIIVKEMISLKSMKKIVKNEFN